MMHTPLYKRLFVLVVVLAACVVALPNLFYAQVERHNDARVASEKAGFATTEQEADMALWPDWLPSGLVNLGLDLRGGAHLLAEVRVEDVYKARMDAFWPEVRDGLRDLRDQTGAIRRQPAPVGELHVRIEKPEGIAAAVEAVQALASPVVSLTGAGSSDIEVTVDRDVLIIRLSEAEKSATDNRTMQQSLEIIRRRVDEVGTREPTIQRQGEDRILIQVPGIGSAAELKALIGTTAKLTFHSVLGRAASKDAPAPSGASVLPSMEQEGLYYIIDDTPVVSGDELVDSQPSFDQNNSPAVSFRFDTTGARKFGEYTAANVGAPFAIVLDGEVISAPVIRDAIMGGSGIISGSFTVEESTNLAVLLRAGALPAEMTFLEERTVGPELGQDSIDAGRRATLIAGAAVGVLMVASYGLFGAFAVVALAINMVMIFAVLSLIGGTLTLPGIAGLVLTIGMAVDANVLIYERIRDEIRNGAKSASKAIELGFERALPAIIDANVTTLITAGVLFFLGAGPVRGFAVTLAIGIFTSVFTATRVTRLIVETWYNWRKPKTIVV